MSGIALIIFFVLAITLMIVAISKWKIHPFISIIGVSLLLAIAVGLPLDTIPATVGKGFSSIFASIGLVIIFGMLIGLILEKTGAAVRLADAVLRLVGPRHPQLAMLLIGWIVSIPVFCDSGFVIVNPIRRSLARKTASSSVSLTVALAAGLYVSHVFIPPTPGPVAAAGMVGLENKLMVVIGVGVVVSVFALIPAYFFSKSVGKRVRCIEDDEIVDAGEYERMFSECGKLPSTMASLVPILLPVLLMGFGSVASMLAIPGIVGNLASFLGKPVIALIAGFISAIPLLYTGGRKVSLYDICQDSLKTAGPIIFITAAGSVLGQVIVEAGFIQYIKENAGLLSAIGVFFPFIIAAILKSAQGSSTVAITTTAALMGLFDSPDSMMAALGMNTEFAASLIVMAIGAGAMTVSHANDSFFWVVTNFGKLKVEDGYRTHTLLTLIMGVSSVVGIFLLSLIFL